MDLYLTNTKIFTFQDINWWTGVVWITSGLLGCFYARFHSDGTHSRQRIHWWASHVMLHFSKSVPMKRQTHLHLGWPGDIFRQILWTVPLKVSMHIYTAWMYFKVCCSCFLDCVFRPCFQRAHTLSEFRYLITVVCINKQ